MKKLYALVCTIFLVGATMAQAPLLKDSAFIPNKKILRQYDYENRSYPFPAKKKDKWAIGVHGGAVYMFGDISAKFGWGAGLRIHKALGHVFSLRLEGLYGQEKGQDYTPRVNPYNPGARYYGNYKMQYGELLLEGMATLNNINFYQKQPRVLINVFLGAGVMFNETRKDELDASGNLYDYSGISSYTKFGEQTKIQNEIKKLRDNNYETVVTSVEDKAYIKNWKVNPAITFGAGLAFRVSKLIDITLEDRITYYNSDQLDGTNLTRRGQYSGNSDFINYASVGLNFKIGKRAEPHYWMNPLIVHAESIQQNAANMDTMKKTVAKMKGDMKPSDLDGDGVPDSRDAEPFSPKGAKVDDRGVALDSDNDGVKDVADAEANTPEGAHADAKGREIERSAAAASAAPAGVVSNSIASVFFDLNKSDLKNEYYTELIKVANYLRDHANVTVLAVGNADVRASDNYNMKLSEKRIQTCIDILTKTLGVDPSRIQRAPKGETEPIVPNLSDKQRKDDGRYYLNRRVDFKVQ
ncbi:MAG: OmpA family protein [Chitinophagales bacterium]